MITDLFSFDEYVTCDFEYHAPPGEIPVVINMAAHENISGRRFLLWGDEFHGMEQPPFRIDERTLFICFAATAELSAFHALRWPEPYHILDLYAEERVINNGKFKGKGQFGLLETCRRYGVNGIAADEKTANQSLAVRGGPFSSGEKRILQRYVRSDVEALDKLYPIMMPLIKHPRIAMFRSGYTKAVARTEHAGTPVDPQISVLKKLWPERLPQLVEQIDLAYGVYDDMRFSQELFEDYLDHENIPWEETPSGLLKTDRQTFSDMSRVYPQLQALHELRKCVSETRDIKLAVGSDFRNRCGLIPFGTETGRNAPSGNKFLFNCSKWFRFLVKPEKGWALSNLDFRAQEIQVGAALSGDPELIRMYETGDPYSQMAIAAGKMPAGGSKKTHPHIRALFKELSLGVIYGMSNRTLALNIKGSVPEADALMRFHKTKFEVFWTWLNRQVANGLVDEVIWTKFGWYRHLRDQEVQTPFGLKVKGVNMRSIQNFFMQAHAAHILQVSMIKLWDAGIQVCAPVHDSVLIYCPEDEIEDQVKLATDLMEESSRIVLDGKKVDVENTIVRYPDRLGDESEGAVQMWNKILELCPEIKP